MHNKYIITYECHDNDPQMWKVVQLIREIFWLLPVLSPLLPVVFHFSFVSTWKRSHFSLWFQSSRIGGSYFLVKWKQCQINVWMYLCYCHKIKSVIDSRWTVSISCWQNRPTKEFKPVSTSTFKTPDWVYHFIIYHNIDWYDTKCTLVRYWNFSHQGCLYVLCFFVN